jgi:hypothetical protein
VLSTKSFVFMIMINERDFRNLNLNLLLVFHALLAGVCNWLIADTFKNPVALGDAWASGIVPLIKREEIQADAWNELNRRNEDREKACHRLSIATVGGAFKRKL